MRRKRLSSIVSRLKPLEEQNQTLGGDARRPHRPQRQCLLDRRHRQQPAEPDWGSAGDRSPAHRPGRTTPTACPRRPEPTGPARG